MAGSNWEQLAFDGEGKRMNDLCPDLRVDGAVLVLYKNYIYVEHEGMWVDGGPFNRPTIAKVTSGEVDVAGFGITAVRHDFRQAMFVVEHDGSGDLRYSGVSCYGFSDDGKWEGVTDELFEAFLGWLEQYASEDYLSAVRLNRSVKA